MELPVVPLEVPPTQGAPIQDASKLNDTSIVDGFVFSFAAQAVETELKVAKLEDQLRETRLQIAQIQKDMKDYDAEYDKSKAIETARLEALHQERLAAMELEFVDKRRRDQGKTFQTLAQHKTVERHHMLIYDCMHKTWETLKKLSIPESQSSGMVCFDPPIARVTMPATPAPPPPVRKPTSWRVTPVAPKPVGRSPVVPQKKRKRRSPPSSSSSSSEEESSEDSDSANASDDNKWEGEEPPPESRPSIPVLSSDEEEGEAEDDDDEEEEEDEPANDASKDPFEFDRDESPERPRVPRKYKKRGALLTTKKKKAPVKAPVKASGKRRGRPPKKAPPEPQRQRKQTDRFAETDFKETSEEGIPTGYRGQTLDETLKMDFRHMLVTRSSELCGTIPEFAAVWDENSFFKGVYEIMMLAWRRGNPQLDQDQQAIDKTLLSAMLRAREDGWERSKFQRIEPKPGKCGICGMAKKLSGHFFPDSRSAGFLECGASCALLITSVYGFVRVLKNLISELKEIASPQYDEIVALHWPHFRESIVGIQEEVEKMNERYAK